MKPKYENAKNYLHYLERSIAVRLIDEADLTAKEKEILKKHELEKSVSIKDLAAKYNVAERCILQTKQNALRKINSKVFM